LLNFGAAASVISNVQELATFLDGTSIGGTTDLLSAHVSEGQLVLRVVTAGGDAVASAAINVFLGTDSVTAAQTGLTDLTAGTNALFHDNAASLHSLGSLIGSDETLGTITLASEDGEDILIDGTKASIDKLGLSRQGGSEDAIGIGLSVTSLANASNAIERIDDALDSISSTRAELGAVQNRLGTTISNLETVSQNLAAANSRIKDADFASETAEMTKAQILQQAGISILSQANASAQSVLSLLG
ncbi:MAG: hypothetical protein JKY67_20315, partial [Pseudomonadales bacterium]|nr:hypothetical protein [Pseudomonadales bacterium]